MNIIVKYGVIDKFIYHIVSLLIVIVMVILTVEIELSVFHFKSVLLYNDILTPLIEELFKTLAITFSGAIAILYTLFFSVAEAINYIILYEKIYQNRNLFSFALFRILCIFFHFFLLWLQWSGYRLYLEKEKARYWFIGFASAYSCHFLWNVGAGRTFYILFQKVFFLIF